MIDYAYWLDIGIKAATLVSIVVGIGTTLRRIKDVEVRLDGRLTELIAANKIVDHAAGKVEGIAMQKAREDGGL